MEETYNTSCYIKNIMLKILGKTGGVQKTNLLICPTPWKINDTESTDIFLVLFVQFFLYVSYNLFQMYPERMDLDFINILSMDVPGTI